MWGAPDWMDTEKINKSLATIGCVLFDHSIGAADIIQILARIPFHVSIFLR